MQGVIPYLAIVDSEKAASFCKAAFGAIQHGETVKSPTGRVMNVGIKGNGGMIRLLDAAMKTEFPEEAPSDAQGMTLQLVVTDGDFWWNRAVAAGCTAIDRSRKSTGATALAAWRIRPACLGRRTNPRRAARRAETAALERSYSVMGHRALAWGQSAPLASKAGFRRETDTRPVRTA
jgi:uncharacterized glyoxalase superfamily protein PhnB